MGGGESQTQTHAAIVPHRDTQINTSHAHIGAHTETHVGTHAERATGRGATPTHRHTQITCRQHT